MRNFKMSQKRITIFTLLIMLCNFFIPQIMMVKAENTNEVQKKIYSIDDKITNINTLIETSKNDDLYANDVSFNVATNYFAYLFNEIVNEYSDTKEELESIKLSDLILLSDEGVTNNYTKYINMGNVDIEIDINNLQNIKFDYDYLDSENVPVTVEITLLTIEQQETLINTNYLNSILLNLNNYTVEKLNGYKSDYSLIIESINNKITNINTIITEIKAYEEAELLLNNVPNIIVNNQNIYDLLDDYILLLNELKEEVDLINNDYINNEINAIINNVNNTKDIFDLNNSNFTSLSLEADLLINEYNTINSEYTDFLTNNSITEEELLTDKFKSVVDAEFINLSEDVKELEEKYNALLAKINEYLERRPSDSIIVNKKIESLETSINGKTINYFATILEEVVDNSDLTSEDVVDLFRTSTLLSDETKKELLDAKLSLYPINLKDEKNYMLITKDNYLVLDGLKILDSDELVNNILYSNMFTLTKEENKYFVTIFDKNDKEIIKYEVLIKNDLNGDNKVDELDLNEIKNILLKKNFSDFEKFIFDINNDQIININDVTDLQSIINNTYINSEANEALFRVISSEENNLITYKIYLLTNGIVNGLEFNINVSDDLNLKEIDGLSSLIYDLNNTNKVYGLDSYSDETLLLTLVYELNNDKSSETTFELNNGLVVFDNGNILNNLFDKDVITRIFEEKEETTNNVVHTNNTIENNEEEQEKSDDNKLVVTTSNEEVIEWNNVIKVVLVILLGVLIIYFLNKTDEQEQIVTKNDTKKTEEK